MGKNYFGHRQNLDKANCHLCPGYIAETVATAHGIKTWEWCRREEKDGIRFLNLEFLRKCPVKTWHRSVEPLEKRS